MGKEREHWADIAKGIGIILVILGHIKYIYSPIKNWIYTFHMPLFFFISGYFVNKQKSFFKDVKHKAYILLIPYLILSIIEFTLEDLLSLIRGIKPTYFTSKHILGLLIQFPNPNAYESQFWFFGCLFITSVILLALVYIFKENKYKILISSIGLIIVGTILIKVLNIRLIWNIDIAIIMTFYAACGYFTRQSHILDKYNSIDRKHKIIIIIICGILGLLFMKLTNIERNIDYYTRNINRPIFCYLAGISNIMFIVILCKSIEGYFVKRSKLDSKATKLEVMRSEDIEFIGRNSGAYYVLSAWGIHVGYFAISLLEQIISIKFNCIYIIITFLISIITPIPIILVLNKVLPHVFGNGNMRKKNKISLKEKRKRIK